jgi:hypothetical protein
MAVRIDASGEKLYRTANLPNRSNFTISGWAYRHASVGSTYQYFVGMEDATSNASAWALAGWLDTGVWHISTSSGYQTGTGPSTGAWFYWYLRCDNSTSPDTYTLGWKPAGGSWTNISVTYDLTFTPAWLILGNDSYDEWSSISFERVRVWDAALTTTELDSEMASATPVRTSSLRSNWPLTVYTDLTDTTANGYTLSSSGTLSTYTPGPSFGASLTATLGALTVSAAGAVAVKGTLTGTLGAATLAATGTVGSTPATGSLSATLGVLTVSATGAVAVKGTLAGTLGALTVSAAGAGAVHGAVSATLGSLTLTAQGYILTSATVGGVLTVDPTNSRYFRNGSGIVLLSGFHHWNEFYDEGPSYPPSPLDYTTWLDYLDARGVNYHKLWLPETARQWADADHFFEPLPYERTGPGNGADGRLKFDLTKFNPTFFERLRERVILAGNRGHYVVVKFFEGWQIDRHGYTYYPFDYHPYQNGNNINSIDGDINNDRNGEETRDLAQTAIVAYQQAYIEKIIDTLNDLDNVLWEISNEDVSTSTAWQYHWIDHVHSYEAGKAKQHPVGMSALYHPADDSELFASNAEWIAGIAAFPAPEAVDGTKVYLYDTDHVMGLTDNHVWVWRSVCRGYNPIYMDEYAGTLYGNDTRAVAANERIRYNLGAVRDYAARLDLAHMTPQNALSNTGHCLAKVTGAYQFLVFQDYSGAFTLNLTSYAGTFALEWLRTNATTPTVQNGGTVAGGATRTLTPPWAGEDVVAFLELTGINGSLTATLGVLTVTGAGVIAVTGALAGTLGSLAVAATAVVTVKGSVTATLGALTAAGTGVAPIIGTATITLGALTLTATGIVAVTGALAGTLGSLTVAALGFVGEVPIQGTLAATLGNLTLTATGVVPVTGTLSATLGVLTLAGASVVPVTGAVSGTLGALVVAAAGAVTVTGSANVVLGELTLSAAGYVGDIPAITGTLNITLGSLTVAGAGVVMFVTTFGRVTGPGGRGTVSGPKASSTIGV